MSNDQQRSSVDALALINETWDYRNPADSEIKFREMLPAAEKDNYELYLQLQTQVARALGLQSKFTEAHDLLDEVSSGLKPSNQTAAIRYHLERGRVYNSNKQPDKAVPEFHKALDLAVGRKRDFLAVDAAHMLGIADVPQKRMAWNLEALSMAENSENEQAKGWQGSLLNNIAWTYHDEGDFEEALKHFIKAEQYWEAKDDAYRLFVARWAVARAHRSLGNIDTAIEIQDGLKELIENGKADADGYVYEELAECYLVKGSRELSTAYFGKAYELLSKDDWMMANEKDRMARILELSKN